METDTTFDSRTEVDPASWRLITLTLPNPGLHGEFIRLQLLRLTEWIREQKAAPEEEALLEVEGMGVESWARVEDSGGNESLPGKPLVVNRTGGGGFRIRHKNAGRRKIMNESGTRYHHAVKGSFLL